MGRAFGISSFLSQLHNKSSVACGIQTDNTQSLQVESLLAEDTYLESNPF